MPDRDAAVAANWKMHKTVAEAERFLDEFLPRVAGAGVEIVICPPFTSLHGRGRALLSGRGPGRRPEHARGRAGAFTGEISAPMLRRARGRGGDRRALRAPPALRRDRRSARAQGAGGARRRARADPLRAARPRPQRDAEETEAVLRRQLEADLAEVADARLGEVVIAYEPIWAIGTGRTATPEQAQEAIALHPRAGRRARDRGAAARSGSSTAARSSPTTPPSCSPQPDIDGALVGGASLEPGDFAAIVAAARLMALPAGPTDPGPLAGLVILDGWGLAPGPRQRGLAGRHAGLRRALDGLPAHDALDLRPRRRPARGPDGQLRGGAPQPRRRRRRQAGPGPDRRRDRRRQLLREPGAAGGLRARPATAPAAGCT